MEGDESPSGMLESFLPGWIKWLKPQVVGIVFVGSALLILMPDSWLSGLGGLGLVGFRRTNRTWIGLAFLVSIACLIVYALPTGYAFLKRDLLNRYARQRLHKLTPDEKTILRGYIDGETRTQYFNRTNGIVLGLVAEGILFLPTNMGQLERFPFNIQSWAWDYLDKHRDLLRP
jgi:Super-infection exclusion protein B